MPRHYKYLDLVTATFVTVLLLSNLLSSAKIIDLGISIGSIPLIFDAGTLVFPISYIFGDILTEIYGFNRSRRVIWLGFFATVLMVFFVWVTGQLPGEFNWQSYAGQGAYDAILGGISGLAVASLVAYLIGSFTNSYILARMKVATKGRLVWGRTIASTLAGQAVDTIAFIGIATLLNVFPSEQFVALVITNYLFKVGIEVILTPVTLQVISMLKKVEGEDYFDATTRFNPFRFNTE